MRAASRDELARQVAEFLAGFVEGAVWESTADEGAARIVDQIVVPFYEALAGRPAQTVIGARLTSRDPEPPPGTLVATEGGEKWRRYPDMAPGSWLMEGHEDGDPETWRKVAGNYGPATVLELGEAT